MIPAALLFITSFFFLFKINYFHYMLSQGFTQLFHAIFISVYIYASKWIYCRHWKIWWNMFAYHCCRLISGLFSHPSIFFIIYSTLVFSEVIITFKKSLFSHTFVTQVCFLFWRNELNSNNKNHHYFMMLFLLIMLINFLLQDNAIFFPLESLKEFNDLSYVLKLKQCILYIFSFSASKTVRAIVKLFSLKFFPIIFFWWKIYTFPVIFIYKWFNFCYSLWIFFSFFFLYSVLKTFVIFSLMGFIVAFLFFIQSEESLYDPPWLGFNFWHL